MSRLLVLGSGVSGMAAARLGRRLAMQVTIYAETADHNVIEEGFASAFGEWDSGLLRGVDLVVASPGFSERSLPIVEALESGLPIWSEIEFAASHIEAPLVAVTGTNGKTSVTEATAAMLDASGLHAPATGNIGAPLSDFTDAHYDALIVEVSSFQLRFTESFHPVAACITNIAADHLDWHGSAQAYTDAKRRIYMNQTENDLLVYDADDQGAASLSTGAPSKLYPVSGTRMPEGGGGVEHGLLTVENMTVEVSDLTSSDATHLVNLASAAALSMRIGASARGVESAARSFHPGAHRRELVADVDGVRWIDDSKATNPHAAVASIRALDSVILIAGGLSKGLDISQLAAEPNVSLLLGIGDAGPGLVDQAGERGRLAGTLDLAVEMAAQAAQTGDTVLLAPGCASFDQFDSYGARGDRFEELVLERLGGRS